MTASSAPESRLRRLLARLGRALDPAAADRQRLTALTKDVRDNTRRDAARIGKRMDALERAVSGVAVTLSDNQRQLADVDATTRRQRDLLARHLEHSSLETMGARAERRAENRLRRIAQSRRPIIVGPWTGEIGFELLYWIPFLQWACRAFALEPERLIVVSRGGVAAWYGHLTPQYEEVFSHATTDEFRAATIERKKQRRLRRFDRALIRRVMRARELTRADLLHPQMMYALFATFWSDTSTTRQLERHSKIRVLPAVDARETGLPALPKSFVAVKFYFSDCFPDTKANRAFAARVVDGMAAQGDVVLLNNHFSIDDHHDFAPQQAARIHRVECDRPETNLAMQTAVLRRASAFVGTYGGFSYLAPFYGVPSVGFYADATFERHHLEYALRVFERLGSVRLTAIAVSDTSRLASTFAGLLASDSAVQPLDIESLRQQLSSLSWGDRFERLHDLDRAAAAERTRLAELRDELALQALEEMRPQWNGAILKHQVARLPEKRMRPPLTRAGLTLRDRLIRSVLQSGALPSIDAPPEERFGVGFDERVIELPLALKVARLDEPGDVLDAGAALNLPIVRETVPRSTATLIHFTLPGSDEPIWRHDPHVTYEFGDLRALPFADGRFDRIVCVSTLEHVGMDTTRFGASRAAGTPESAADAVAELVRVLKPGGELLLTMPYGVAADRGWYRIFDGPARDTLLAATLGMRVDPRYFYYDRGWFEAGPAVPPFVLAGAHDPESITGLLVVHVIRQPGRPLR